MGIAQKQDYKIVRDPPPPRNHHQDGQACTPIQSCPTPQRRASLRTMLIRLLLRLLQQQLLLPLLLFHFIPIAAGCSAWRSG